MNLPLREYIWGNAKGRLCIHDNKKYKTYQINIKKQQNMIIFREQFETGNVFQTHKAFLDQNKQTKIKQ